MIRLLSPFISSPAADAAHDAAHETAARFRQGPYSVECTTCHVPAGELCLARRTVHAARRALHRSTVPKSSVLSPLYVRSAR